MNKPLVYTLTLSMLLSSCGTSDKEQSQKNNQNEIKKAIKNKEKKIEKLEKEKEKLKVELDKKAKDLKDTKNKLKEKDESNAINSNNSKMVQAQPLPNTIQDSTNGDVKLLHDLKEIDYKFEDRGIKVKINHIQIFQVDNMAEGQVLLFNGAKKGYVALYEVETENTTNGKLYYDNMTAINSGGHLQRSDGASFIPELYNEQHLKKSKINVDEYQPNEKTKSLKAIPISEQLYKALKRKKATFDILGGVSTKSTYEDASKKSKPFVLNIP